MNHRLLNSIILLTVVVLSLWLNIIGENIQLAKVISGLTFILLLPGFSLTMTIFPVGTLSGSRRIVFSITLSLAISALGGVLLNLTPWGLQASSWLTFLGLFSLIFSVTGIFRHENGRQVLYIDRFTTGVNLVQITLLAFGIVFVIAAITAARIGEIRQDQTGFTQFWITPGSNNSINLGVHNYESINTKYKSYVLANDQIVFEQIFELEPDESWSTTINLPIDSEVLKSVDAQLFLLNKPTEIYRHVTLSQLSSAE